MTEDEAPRGQWRAMTDARRTSDEYAVWLGQLLAQAGVRLADIDEAIVSSVVPQGIGALKSLCADHCGCEAQVVGEPGVALGIAVNVPRPEEVGADRLVNTVGAHIRHAGALIILDFGTATTFDSVSAEGAYEGGIIAPGIGLSLEALHQAAAQLPRIAVKRPEQVIAKATVPAMQSGIYWGYVGLIEGIVARMKAEIAAPGDDGRDRRTGRPLRRCHGRDRRGRSGPHDPGPARDPPAQSKSAVNAPASATPSVQRDALHFLPLGGAGEIGMNLNLYACQGQWLMVDLGITFAGDTLPGIDVLMPDPTYIEERRKDLLAIVLTHAHEDHLGAVAYLWPRLRCPVYATPFAAAVLREKLADAKLLSEVPLTEVALSSRLDLGPFALTFISLTHSIPEPNALLIETPYGRVMHTGDWKIDP